MKKKVVMQILNQPEGMEDLLRVLDEIGIECEMQKDIWSEQINVQLSLVWNETEVQRRITRNAGQKGKKIKRAGIPTKEVRKWIDATS